MRMVLSEYAQLAIPQWIVGLATPPASLYVGLCTDMPDESVDGTTVAAVEVSPTGTGYARQPIAPGGANWATSGLGVVNSVVVTFPTSLADWGVVKQWMLCDAVTGGNFILASDLPVSGRVLPGVVVSLEEGAMTLIAQSPTETIVT